MKKILSVSLSLCLLAVLLSSCSLKEEKAEITVMEEIKTEFREGHRVGVIIPSLGNEFLSGLGERLQEGLEAHGMEAELVSSDNDPAKELQLLENFATMKVEHILIFPIGASASEVGTTLRALRNKGIKVHVFGNEVTKGSFDSEVVVDQFAVGEEKAKEAARWIDATFWDAEDGSVEVALLSTTTSVESKNNSEGMELITQYTKKAVIVENIDLPMGEAAAKVQEAVDLILTRYPNIKAILTYDSPQAFAADETVLGMGNVDKSQFGIFTSDFTAEMGKRILMSEKNESLIRATIMFGDGSYSPQIDAILGTLELNNENIYYYEIYAVSLINVADYMH